MLRIESRVAYIIYLTIISGIVCESDNPKKPGLSEITEHFTNIIKFFEYAHSFSGILVGSKQKAQELEGHIKSLNSSIVKFEQNLESVEENLGTLDRKTRGLTTDSLDTRDHVRTIENDIKSLKKTTEEFKAESSLSFKSLSDKIASNFNALNDNIKKLNDTMEKLESKLNDTMEKLESKVNENSKDISKLTKNIDSLTKKMDSFISEMKEKSKSSREEGESEVGPVVQVIQPMETEKTKE